VLARVLAAAAATAASLLAVGLAVRVSLAVPVALGLLGGGYVALLGFEAEGLHASAPLVAGGLYAIAELAYWSLELRAAIAEEAGALARRVAFLLGLALLGMLLGAVMLALVGELGREGLWLEWLGAAAAVGALVLVLAAARDRRT
jgi:hypothetical protein